MANVRKKKYLKKKENILYGIVIGNGRENQSTLNTSKDTTLMLFDTRKLKYAILKQFENKCIHILRKRLHIKISSVQQNYDRIQTRTIAYS